MFLERGGLGRWQCHFCGVPLGQSGGAKGESQRVPRPLLLSSFPQQVLCPAAMILPLLFPLLPLLLPLLVSLLLLLSVSSLNLMVYETFCGCKYHSTVCFTASDSAVGTQSNI